MGWVGLRRGEWRVAALALIACISLRAHAAPAKDVTLSFGIDDPFVAGKSAVDVQRAIDAGQAVELPEVRLEVEGQLVYGGRLVALGSLKSHMSFGGGSATLPSRSSIVKVRFRVPSRGIDWSRTVDLAQGRIFIVTEGHDRSPVRLEQLKQPRYYL